MKVRNAHTHAFTVAGGLVVAPGDVWMNAPESFRASPLVRAGVFVPLEEEKPAVVETAPEVILARDVRGRRSGRGGK